MRDPARIERILLLIQEIWQRDPDMRFQQLIYVLQNKYSQTNSGYGIITETAEDGFQHTGFDMFNLEDDDLERFLTKFISEHRK
ncbi:hypothetical protein SAMN02745181_3208 [Rubritalea squalenifaciens DSM 18772]|uniref:Uncharacterized protein n=1 Tax=Rubritalea squalenifaciens DSM 18772 TaxID=1123071 RepID=A0A1M6PJD2_9BACT|nr:hypothetical protein [Rubritalea squalenifaciens]SHK08040.1 hypothetical protein SAMN02745181_3208 [Rubritalea squalenifaciens DSM 18772]